jgi:hypothetical protein
MEAILNRNKVRLAASYAAANTSAVEGNIIDCQGAASVAFFGTIATANAGNYIKVQQSDAAAMGDAADLEGSKVICATSGEIVGVEIVRPAKRYLRVYITRTASTVTGDFYAVSNNVNVQPADNNETEVIVSEIHITPDEGTC